MRRWLSMIVAGLAVLAGVMVAPAPRASAVSPIGRLGVVLLDKVTGTHLAQWNLY